MESPSLKVFFYIYSLRHPQGSPLIKTTCICHNYTDLCSRPTVLWRVAFSRKISREAAIKYDKGSQKYFVLDSSDTIIILCIAIHHSTDPKVGNITYLPYELILPCWCCQRRKTCKLLEAFHSSLDIYSTVRIVNSNNTYSRSRRYRLAFLNKNKIYLCKYLVF